jgi:hypothetical protein
MKIHQVEAKLFHADRQTDMTKLVVVFAIFLTPKKVPME